MRSQVQVGTFTGVFDVGATGVTGATGAAGAAVTGVGRRCVTVVVITTGTGTVTVVETVFVVVIGVAYSAMKAKASTEAATAKATHATVGPFTAPVNGRRQPNLLNQLGVRHRVAVLPQHAL